MNKKQLSLIVGWLVYLFYGLLTFFDSFNTELSHFDAKFQIIQFNIRIVFLFIHC